MKLILAIKTDTMFHLEFSWRYENELHYMQTWRDGHNTIRQSNK